MSPTDMSRSKLWVGDLVQILEVEEEDHAAKSIADDTGQALCNTRDRQPNRKVGGIQPKTEPRNYC
jgi:hypothetical protein